MIGVLANATEHGVVREFFELFKTPWEFYRSGGEYEVVLCAGDVEFSRGDAKLVLIYAGDKTSFDVKEGICVEPESRNRMLVAQEGRIPIYGRNVTFRGGAGELLADEISRRTAAFSRRSGSGWLVRVGYDLFEEARVLLTEGQPATNAGIPALEKHISLLRALIVGSAIPLVEIPPVPDGYRFIACLTHDVDHPSIRQHKWDHTAFGFLHRATLGSLINVIRGRAPARNLMTNWGAALILPLVYLGLARDFWLEFDRYLEIEKGLGSTFFVMPFKDYPGQSASGRAPGMRASRYDIQDIAGLVRKLMSAGSEIGLHGIDAWLDSSKGCEERNRVSSVTGESDIGVRMHWLYADERSPANLDKAGFSYDSTIGYNETVGFRAGTAQAFRPLEAARLLELPLLVMDTALFYPSHLNLSASEARERVQSIIDQALVYGGVVTVNWHDRSIAPERLWDEFYEQLIQELKSREAWFPTAAQAVTWFRKRRTATFETVDREGEALRLKASVEAGYDSLPALKIRVHKPRNDPSGETIRFEFPGEFTDLALAGGIDTIVNL